MSDNRGRRPGDVTLSVEECQNVRAWRKLRKMSQLTFAATVGVSPSTVYHIEEAARKHLRPRVRAEIRDALLFPPKSGD